MRGVNSILVRATIEARVSAVNGIRNITLLHWGLQRVEFQKFVP